MTDSFGASDLRRGVREAAAALRAVRDRVDALNVYPVPDADTGTNMMLTFEAVADAAAMAGNRDHEIAHAIRSGALRGARGNSGVIVAQILLALADAVEAGPIDHIGLGRAFKRAVELAYDAVLEPAEGTILSVVRAAAEGVRTGHASAVAALDAAAAAAVEAVARTPSQMDLLRRAGVVDAGGAGLAVALAAIARACGGSATAEVPSPSGGGRVPALDVCERGSTGYAFEVMYALRAPDRSIPAFRDLLGTIGDSVAVIGADGVWRVHVHTNETDRALALGAAIGETSEVSITSFDEQMQSRGARGVELMRTTDPAALVVEVVGDGNRARFSELGARVVDPDGLSAAIDDVSARSVVVVATTDEGAERARAAAAVTSKSVRVFGVDGPAPALGVAASFTDDRPWADVVSDMEEAIARIRCARAPAERVVEAAVSLAGGSAELVTCVAPAGVEAEARAAIERALAAALPRVTVEVLDGGHGGDTYSVAVE